MTEATHEPITRPQTPRWSVPALAGLATVAVTTMAAFTGPVGILIGWLGGSVACGLVLLWAGDERATRATVAMLVLLPASVDAGSGSGSGWHCAPPQSSSPATSSSTSPPAPERSTVGSSSSCWPTLSRSASTWSACTGPGPFW